MYWAIPIPVANGRCAKSRSRERHPSIFVSSVTTIASHPQASARPTKLATSSSEVLQYSWNHRVPSPIAPATCSIGLDAWFEKITGTPSAAAAFPTAMSASLCASSSTPIGAIRNGVGRRRPRSSTDRSRSETSRSTRGTIFQRSSAARFAAIVRSAPAPPAMYAYASGDSRLLASRSSFS